MYINHVQNKYGLGLAVTALKLLLFAADVVMMLTHKHHARMVASYSVLLTNLEWTQKKKPTSLSADLATKRKNAGLSPLAKLEGHISLLLRAHKDAFGRVLVSSGLSRT